MTATRWTPAAFVAAGLAFLLFPLLRPWPDESVATADLATAFASDRWVLAHLCGILGLALLAPALLGLRTILAQAGPADDDAGAGPGAGAGANAAAGAGARAGSRAGVGTATWALITAWVGAGCAALYFGAEIFGLRTLAEAALRENDLGLLAHAEVLRMQPGAIALFGAGLFLLAVAGVLVAVALWRAGGRPRWAGVPLAIGLVLVLPQFFGGPGLRITHGFLVAAGCVLVAVAARSRAGRV
ncbi:hypothetical protein APR04_003307 [Promicromonospora umidemergens]|uniref:DUF4386 family protein n=1 Tax=Promicromonospora umidemergens TaxID=629679 RepID=A0ABP8WD72_9MICO|nr:hypothetical protein [Promicromonospora umidemergens]MCP2284386.1 hypothetical protein [Promicromonospora umidemergens]